MWTACVVFCPLLWSELRWWSPDDSRERRKVLLQTVLILGATVTGFTLAVQKIAYWM